MEIRSARFLPALVVLAASLLAACGPAGPPDTRRDPVEDTYHGVTVTDDYRWLEDSADSEVQAWTAAQDGYTRGILESLPDVEAIRARIDDLQSASPPRHYGLASRGDRLFAMRLSPDLQQPILVVLEDVDDPSSARTLVDPATLDPESALHIDFYVPSFDGTKVAVSMSRGGSESGDVHVYDVATGEELGSPVPRVNGGTAGGSVAWTPDGDGFFHTRYPRDGERAADELAFHQEVWFHRLDGGADADRYELGRDHPKIAEFRVRTDRDTGRVLASYQFGDSGRFEHHLRKKDGSWTRITTEDDRIVQATFAPDGALFLLSRLDAPNGKVLRLAPGETSFAKAKLVVPEGDDALVSDFYRSSPMIATADRLYLTVQLGGPSTIRAFDHAGAAVDGPEILPVSRVGQIVPLRDGEILFPNESYLEPGGWYRFSETSGATTRTGLDPGSPVRFEGVEVIREFAASADGTAVPINILRPEGIELDGSHPTLLTGYGGFGVSLAPSFNAERRIWTDQGGVYVIANLRGGGEYGEAWHDDGRLTRKQNVFDDFAAAMEFLIDAGYTRPDRLAIRGGSNGGLLMGAMITQQPALCRAVVSHVGIYDMLRVELSSNGAFNIPEYGTVANEDHFAALHGYSPYHHVTDGEAYPAVLFLTGANDPRVDPMQSRKMTARLQAANVSDRDILLRASADSGHGGAVPRDKKIQEAAEVYAFLFRELGVRPTAASR